VRKGPNLGRHDQAGSAAAAGRPAEADRAAAPAGLASLAVAVVAIGLAFLLWIVLPAVHTSTPTNLTYSQFLSDVNAHQIKSVTIQSNGKASGALTSGHDYTTVIPVQLAGSSLLDSLEAAKVSIVASTPGTSFGSELLSWILILGFPLLLIGLWLRMSKGAGGALQGAMGVGKARAKVFDAERPQTTFADVAGYEGAKAEIAEVVDFLRQPERYRRVGATAPRGVLMVGPPGTGKTLLARAVAGEAGSPSSRWPAPASWRCSSVSAPPGSGISSPRPASGPRRSCS
jgi:cell division protease FtsH